MKIMIIGYSGSGKSTLANNWHTTYQLSVLYLDQVHWLPNWAEQEQAKEQEIVSSFLQEHEDWIIEGNYASLSYEKRIQQADLILFFDFPRFRCLMRAMKRYIKYHGTTRPSMSEACEEKMDWDFIRWIILDGRSRHQRQRYQQVLNANPHKAIRIQNQRTLNRITKTDPHHLYKEIIRNKEVSI